MSERKIGIGGMLIGALGVVTTAGVVAAAAEHCAEEKTKRRSIALEETKYVCDTQERIETIKSRIGVD